MIQHEDIEAAKHVIDGLGIGTLFGAFWGLLPHAAFLLTIAWFVLRLYNAYLDMKIKKKELAK